MSTPGKVLVVLVLLVAPIWVLMVSAVAQLNRNGGEQVAKLTQEIATLEKNVADTKNQIVDLKDKIELEQLATQDELATIRAHQIDLQKARSQILEIASRVSLQQASTQEEVKQAMSTRDLRVAEKKEETEALHATEAEVEKLQQTHEQLVEQLNKLRDEFKTTLDSNRALLARLKSRKSS